VLPVAMLAHSLLKVPDGEDAARAALRPCRTEASAGAAQHEHGSAFSKQFWHTSSKSTSSVTIACRTRACAVLLLHINCNGTAGESASYYCNSTAMLWHPDSA
jgi:hypothetical protein